MNDEDVTKRASDAQDKDPSEGEAEYSFEGFKVEFNERMALTPPAMARARS